MIEIADSLLDQPAAQQSLAYARQAEHLVMAIPGIEITHAHVFRLYGKVFEHLGRLDEAASSLRRAINISQSCGTNRAGPSCSTISAARPRRRRSA